jgi:D-cysteine desulfhydrase family pyridoxal phosphate-dependent enzyme
MTREDLAACIATLPRVSLATLPTPLHEAGNLSRQYGRNILFKRDDLTGFALGGNKTRMFEFILADALEKGADTLVAGAAAQSNYCRQLAAAAARLGLRVILILRKVRDVDGDIQGNLLLDVLSGAEITVEEVSPSRQQELIEQTAARVQADGGRPYLPEDTTVAYLGAVAYVECALEIAFQIEERAQQLSAIFVAAAGETQGGLLLGMKALGLDIPVIGVNPGVDWWDVGERVVTMANQAAARLKLDVTIDIGDVVNTDAYAGRGYGLITPEAICAIKETASCEGVFLDPVYTGKAMAALLDALSQGTAPGEGPILFLHTGGIPALFHYSDELVPGVGTQSSFSRPGT